MPNDNLIPIAKLPAGQPYDRSWVLDRETQRAMATRLGISDLRKARAEFRLTPQAKRDWRLDVTWGATVVQPCVTTLAPVTTRLDEKNTLTFVAKMPEITEAETEMPEDDSLEPLPEALDLEQILEEMIALALPAYPRAQGAEVSQAIFGPPDTAPMTDDDAKPFAALAGLREKLQKDGEDEN